MNDLMREEFEAAYKQETERQGKSFDRSVLTRQASGDYVIGLVQAAWWAWQASRECLVIELPEKTLITDPSDMLSIGNNGAINKCRDAIHITGVKTK